MGTEGDRRRNRARRLRKREQKKIKKEWDIPFKWIIVAILVPWLIYKQYQAGQEHLLLYKTGVETTAFIYDLSPASSHSHYRHYEFYVNDKRYKGVTQSGKLGYTIPIIYLPTDPYINHTVRDLNKTFSVTIYKRFVKENRFE